MTVTIAFAAASDGYLSSVASTYLGAQDGTGTKAVDDTWDRVPYGQGYDGQYAVLQGFMKWTYAVPTGEQVASAALRFYHVDAVATGVSRDLEVRQYAWAAPLAGASFRSRAQLSALTLLGKLNDANAGKSKYALVGSGNLLSVVAGGSGTLSAVLAPVRNVGGSPTTYEYSYVSSAEAAGTTSDPALVFTSAARSTLHGVISGSVKLSDGTWMVLESDGAAVPVVNLRRHTGTAVTTVAAIPLGATAGTFDYPRGTQSFALAVDASDNVYVIGVSGATATSVAVQAYVKSGATWTQKAVMSGAAPGYSAPINNVGAAWHATGGAGILFVLLGHAAGTGNADASTNDVAYAALSASVALAGAGTVLLAGDAAPGLLLPLQSAAGYFNSYTNETGSGLDVIPGTGGVGYLASHGKSSTLGQNAPVGIARYEVTAAGAVTAAYRLSGNYATKDASSKVRVIGIGGTSVAVVTADSASGWGLVVQPYQVTSSGWTALSDPIRLDAESVTGMPAASLLAVSGAWDAVYVPNENKLWIYFPDVTDPRIVRRTGVSLTTYVATRESVTVSTVGAAGGTNLAVRAQRHTPTGTTALVTVAHKSSGAVLSTAYVVDTFNLPPNAPALTPRTNFDATAAAVFAWTVNDPNVGDAQSAYQLQIINAGTSAVVVDTGKVTSATASRTVAGGTLTNGVSYQWRVRTYDALDQVSPYSSYSTFTTGAGGSVTITDPVADNPAGVITDDYLVKWSVAGTTQAGYRIVLVRTDTGATVSDTGWVTSTVMQATVSGMVTDVQHQVQVTVRNASLVTSVTGTRYITPSYGTPEVPLLTVEAFPGGGYVLLTIDNPTPTGDRPAPIRNEVWRRPAGTGEYELIGLALPGDEYRDYSAASGVAYEYKARAVAV